MSILTPEEVKNDHVSTMGEALGNLYHELWNDVARLHSKWKEYVELFGTKPSRVELLNKSAPLFFRTVQDSLWESTLLHITRLTDPPQSCGKDNLSIKRLTKLVNEEIKETISQQIETAVEKSGFCRDWRNRKFAHSDLSLALDNQAEPLEPASRAHIKEALNSIVAVLNTISGHYRNSEVAYDLVIGSGGATSLLYILDDGLNAKEQRKERIAAGNHSPKDFERKAL
jgi:hypothetical protein